VHTYKKTEEGPWTVGFCVAGARYTEWHAIADFDKEREAARLSYARSEPSANFYGRDGSYEWPSRNPPRTLKQ
jgi:hypothetical protein